MGRLGRSTLGNPHEIPVRELAERIIRLTGPRSRIAQRMLPEDDPTQRCPDMALVRRLLGWEPRIGLEVGLERTIAYFDRMLARSEDRGRAGELR